MLCYVISGRSLSLYLFKTGVVKLIGVIIKVYCPIQLCTKFCLADWTKLLGIFSVDFLHLRSGIDPILYIYQLLERN
jgi:hypothetical protein